MEDNQTPLSAPLSNQTRKFVGKLGLDSNGEHNLLDSLSRGNAGRTVLVTTPAAPKQYQPPFSSDENRPEWLPANTTLLIESEKAKPGSHEDYLLGRYYPLDLSSVWETTPLSVIPTPDRCLDLCASPGGKSILTQFRLSPPLHIANEINPRRLGILRNNLSRCGYANLYTQKLRPDQWAAAAPLSFDLILVDAPCSGQSLLARGIDNPGCFHPSVIKGNAKRQRGILHNALACLAPGGHLLYTTCTFSPEENEKNVAYILKKYNNLAATPIPQLQQHQSPLSPFPCYRLLPGSGMGSGGFTCLIAKKGSAMRLPDLDEEILAWPVPHRKNSPS